MFDVKLLCRKGVQIGLRKKQKVTFQKIINLEKRYELKQL